MVRVYSNMSFPDGTHGFSVRPVSAHAGEEFPSWDVSGDFQRRFGSLASVGSLWRVETRKEVEEKEAAHITRILKDMIDWANDEDWFPGGIEPDEIHRVISQYGLSLYTDSDGNKEKILRGVLSRSLATYTGRQYALEHGYGSCTLGSAEERPTGVPSIPEKHHRLQMELGPHSGRSNQNRETIQERAIYECTFKFPGVSQQFESEYSTTSLKR